jgi:hypothetical protein
VNVHVNTFSAESNERRPAVRAAHQAAAEALTESARPGPRERHASCYSPGRRRYANVEINMGRSGRSVLGGSEMAVEKGRDYHYLFRGMTGAGGPDTPHRSTGKERPLHHSPCRIFQAIYPVSLSVHLSARPFQPDRCLGIRPLCGMTAEFTENLTLSRAYARRDSPWSVERLSPAPPGGPTMCLLRMRLAVLRSGTQRMTYATRGVFLSDCIMS